MSTITTHLKLLNEFNCIGLFILLSGICGY